MSSLDAVPALPLDRAYHWERNTPDRLWMTQPTGGGQVRTLTFKQAMDEARRMAAHLRGLSLPAGSHIALLSKNTAHWILADLAIWMAGHVSVPLYPTLTPDTIAQILDHSEAKLIFVGKLDGWKGMKDGIPAALPRIYLPLSPVSDGDQWQALVDAQTPIADSPIRPAEDLATIVYTSGTTGMAKGAMHSFAGLGVASHGVTQHLGVVAEDRMLSYLPLAHVMERFVVECSSFMRGFQLYFAESLDTFVQDLQRARPTLFVSVPRLWLKFQAGVHAKMPAKKLSRLLSIPILGGVVRKKVLKGLGLDQVRFAGTGSAPLPAEVIAWYRNLGLDLLEAYGMTENFCYSHLSRPGRMRVGYVGEPYPEVEHRISAEGEVQVKSPATMRGYYKNPEATKQAITEDGFLRTGDRGELDGEGRLRITGRVKELFKTSKGKYVAPAPVENRLVNHERLEQACVTGSGQPQPCALVVLAEDARKRLAAGELSRDLITDELKAHLGAVNAELNPYERLDFVVVIKEPWLTENGFLTPTMKVKRNAVEDAVADRLEGWYAAQAPVIWE